MLEISAGHSVPGEAMDQFAPRTDTLSPENLTPRLYQRINYRWWILSIGVGLCLAAIPAISLINSSVVTSTHVTLECTPQAGTAAVYQAKLRGYFAAEGLNIFINDHLTGRNALTAMVDKGSGYSTCADTPFTMAYSQGAPLAIIAQTGHTSKFIRVIGRRDRGLTEIPTSLVGHRVGVTLGTNAEYVIYTTCLLFDIAQDQVTIVDLKADQLEGALLTGTVDAVAMWEPFASRTAEVIGDQGVQVKISDFYRSMWLLVAHSGKRDPHCERALLRALIRATDDLNGDCEQWLEPLAREMGRTTNEMRHDLQQTRSRITLDQSLLLELEAQRRWLNLSGPEIYDGLSPRSLSEVAPEAVTLIHPLVVP